MLALNALFARYREVRARTLELIEPLSEEDACVQSMADASPAKWHLAHTTWFFETFVLERWEREFAAFHPSYRVLFNSYYNAVGDKFPRPRRGMLTRPALSEIDEYRKQVDERIAGLQIDETQAADFSGLLILGLQHEQQHQELLLTDIKHLFSLNPLEPAYHYGATEPHVPAVGLTWQKFDGGLAHIGHPDEGFCFDNEAPRHTVWLTPYQLASRLSINAEFAAFIADGGYQNPSFWLAEGWDWRVAHGRESPLYWRRNGGGWDEFTMAGGQPLDPQKPIVHVSYFEADAFARWSSARLPTEAEWEHAANGLVVEGNLAESGVFHPQHASTGALVQMFGDAWEWTQSSYAPYPGFRTAAGAVGEYNGKFMVNQYVLRGGSCVTPAEHIRASYRNFFPAHACWQFSGIRLARDV